MQVGSAEAVGDAKASTLSREIMESAPVPMPAGFGRRLDLAPGLHLDLKTGLIVRGGLAGRGLVFRSTDYVLGLRLVEDI